MTFETIEIENDDLPGVIIPVLQFIKLKMFGLDLMAVEGGDLGKPDQAFMIHYSSLGVVELEDGSRYKVQSKDRLPDGLVHRWNLKKISDRKR